MSDDERFRSVDEYARPYGFAAGFPNFHQADYGQGLVYGTILFRAPEIEWRDVPRSEYGVNHREDVPAMFRAAANYASAHGYEAAFPNFQEFDYGQGVVYGTILLQPGVGEWRDVPRDEIGVYHIEDVPAMMRGVNDYAARAGFVGAFPTFHQADHGAGVVYGVVLLRTGRAYWRDIPADLLTSFVLPPTRWAFILCNLSDLPPAANARDRWAQYFTRAGLGTGGAFDYWRDMSYATSGLRGSEVLGWFDIGMTKTQLAASSGGAQRQAVMSAGLTAAQNNNVKLQNYDHKVIVLNKSCDHGKTGGGVVFGYEDARALEPTFMAHELGHEFGLDHSFGEQSSPCASGDGRPGAYCDNTDIMSAMAVTSFQDAQNRKTGPSLNTLSRQRLGWLHRSRVWNPALGIPQTVRLAAVNRQDVEGYLMATFTAPSRAATGGTSTYTVEFRDATSWDQGLGTPVVLVHEIWSDGLARLLTNAPQGALRVGQELVTPAPSFVVHVEAIAPSTATLRIWQLPQSGVRSVRIVYIDYDPPGRDVDAEYVLIQNDAPAGTSLDNWTLADAAGHVFRFPAYALPPGHIVKVWTRSGTNGPENLYWGRRQAVWNNTGDVATLNDAVGTEISRYAYTA